MKTTTTMTTWRWETDKNGQNKCDLYKHKPPKQCWTLRLLTPRANTQYTSLDLHGVRELLDWCYADLTDYDVVERPSNKRLNKKPWLASPLGATENSRLRQTTRN